VGIISAVLYVLVFYKSKFYADMSLNGYYFFISIYGWIYWRSSGNSGGKNVKVKIVSKKTAVYLSLIFIGFFILIGYLLDHFTDSPLPYWDSLTTSGSIVATWMLTKKILQHWLVWVVVDIVSMCLYMYRGLYPTTILFAVYTTMAVVGFIQWKKSISQ